LDEYIQLFLKKNNMTNNHNKELKKLFDYYRYNIPNTNHRVYKKKKILMEIFLL